MSRSKPKPAKVPAGVRARAAVAAPTAPSLAAPWGIGRMPRLAVGITVLVVALVSVALVYFWKFAFNSDTVLSGLMARSVLERGERPIFVWSVGYQGIMLEVYAIALTFKIFGQSPVTLNFFTCACFWGMCALLYRYVRVAVGFWVGLFSVLFLAVSSSILMTVVMRNIPNYAETFCFGLIAFVWTQMLTQHLYVRGGEINRRIVALSASLGFVLGFAVYTYQQIYYFVASIIAFLGLLYVRDVVHAVRWATPYGRYLLMAIAPGGLCIGVGLMAFFGDRHVQVFGYEGTALATLLRGGLWLAGVALFDLTWRRRSMVQRLLPLAALGSVTAALGYSPALYSTYVRHEVVVDKATATGTWTQAKQHLDVAWQGNLWHLNITDVLQLENAHVRVLVGLVTFAALGTFTLFALRRLWLFVCGAPLANSTFVLAAGPLVMLPWVVLGAFCVSDIIVDLSSSRYTLVLWLYFALAFAWCAVRMLEQRAPLPRVVGIACMVFLLTNNATDIVRAIIRDQTQGFEGEEAIAVMRERGLKYGYANYWLAYTVNFLTQEDIILQPMFSAYCPHYGPLVARADHIAVVDRKEAMRAESVGEALTIRGKPFVKRELWSGRRASVLVLDAADTGQTNALPTSANAQ